jgi:hypothetical protein
MKTMLMSAAALTLHATGVQAEQSLRVTGLVSTHNSTPPLKSRSTKGCPIRPASSSP